MNDMLKSNRELCIEIINSIPEEQLANVITLLKSVKLISDEFFDEDENAELQRIYGTSETYIPKSIDDMDDFAESLGIALN